MTYQWATMPWISWLYPYGFSNYMCFYTHRYIIFNVRIFEFEVKFFQNIWPHSLSTSQIMLWVPSAWLNCINMIFPQNWLVFRAWTLSVCIMIITLMHNLYDSQCLKMHAKYAWENVNCSKISSKTEAGAICNMDFGVCVHLIQFICAIYLIPMIHLFLMHVNSNLHFCFCIFRQYLDCYVVQHTRRTLVCAMFLWLIHLGRVTHIYASVN